LPSARRGSAIISSRVRIGSNAVTVTICSGLLQPILLIQTDPRWGTQNLPARPTKSVAATFRTHIRSVIRTSNPRELNDPAGGKAARQSRPSCRRIDDARDDPIAVIR
jgi:hypothetical protein